MTHEDDIAARQKLMPVTFSLSANEMALLDGLANGPRRESQLIDDERDAGTVAATLRTLATAGRVTRRLGRWHYTRHGLATQRALVAENPPYITNTAPMFKTPRRRAVLSVAMR